MNKTILIIIVIILVGIGGYFLLKGGETSAPTAAPTSAQGVAPGEVEEIIVLPEPEPEPEPAGEVKEFTLTAKQWSFSPSTITVNKGDTVKLSITSTDVIHGLAINEFNVNVRLPVGETKIVEFVADKTGTFSFYCSVRCGSGHSGMRGQLIVK